MTETHPSQEQIIFPLIEQTTVSAFADMLPLKIWMVCAEDSVYHLNQQWVNYTGLPLQEILGRGWRQIVHPDDLEEMQRSWYATSKTGVYLQQQCRLRAKDGIYRWHVSQANPHRDADGNLLFWLGVCIDIHEQKRVEDNLREREAHFRTLAEALPQLVWITGPDGHHEYCNQCWYDYMQMGLEQAHGDGWGIRLHPDDRERTLKGWHYALATGKTHDVQFRLKNEKTGEYRWFLTRTRPLYDRQGNIVKWIGTSADIHEQKRTEEYLRRSQERVRTLMESDIISIIVTDEQYIIEANEAFLTMTGYTREDLRDCVLNWSEMTPSEYACLDQKALCELAQQGRCTPYEKEYLCKDGHRLPIMIGATELQHEPLQWICFILDISERKAFERRKDEFIITASHELKTPLTSLTALTQLLIRQFEKQVRPDVVVTLRKMESQIERLTRLVQELLDLSKMQADQMHYAQEVIDIDVLLVECIATLQQINTTHTLLLHDQAHKRLMGDRDRLEQVLTNLINNAIKYSPDADRVDICVTSTDSTVTISIHDYGIGIPSEDCARIFERFYRVSTPDRQTFPGLGMGLYIASEIVQRHAGTITIESEEAKGATFHVTLPVLQD